MGGLHLEQDAVSHPLGRPRAGPAERHGDQRPIVVQADAADPAASQRQREDRYSMISPELLERQPDCGFADPAANARRYRPIPSSPIVSPPCGSWFAGPPFHTGLVVGSSPGWTVGSVSDLTVDSVFAFHSADAEPAHAGAEVVGELGQLVEAR